MVLTLSFVSLAVWALLSSHEAPSVHGILYPRDSESRQVKSLDGVWNFKLSPSKNSVKGYKERWFSRSLKAGGDALPMPVPASYNDITQDMAIRDYVGVVWYDRTFFVPQSWSKGARVWLRFGSVCYAAQVWVNGQLVTSHEIGHLPFEQEITSSLNFGKENLLSVAVDNTLLATTVPQGTVGELTVGNQTVVTQSYTFDFFNYAGIDRSVMLYTTPSLYISDVLATTKLEGADGMVSYKVSYLGQSTPPAQVICAVELLDKGGAVVASGNQCNGTLQVTKAKLWWPYLMDPSPGYLYTLKVAISEGNGPVDVYRQRIGIRELKWNNKELLINNKPVYIRGLGRHEDSDIRGKGLDLPLVVRDHNLLQWIGANTYRTSHYPYAEEIMDMADEQGIMIINECPSVDTDIFSATLLQKHKKSLTELISRDKNRPSTIMWSVSNEARSHQPAAESYFREVTSHARALDNTRPITAAIARAYTEDKMAQFLDIIGFNRYNSWYSNTGRTEVIYDNVVNEARNWHSKFNKPVIMMEYGADCVQGLHLYPEYVWSEEYQVLMMGQHYKAFDTLRSEGWFIGEMIWNFADFMTAQTTTRVGGNKKGMFTRQRDPKSSAFYIRKRYLTLAHELDNAKIPKDLFNYVAKPNRKLNRTEL